MCSRRRSAVWPLCRCSTLRRRTSSASKSSSSAPSTSTNSATAAVGTLPLRLLPRPLPLPARSFSCTAFARAPCLCCWRWAGLRTLCEQSRCCSTRRCQSSRMRSRTRARTRARRARRRRSRTPRGSRSPSPKGTARMARRPSLLVRTRPTPRRLLLLFLRRSGPSARTSSGGAPSWCRAPTASHARSGRASPRGSPSIGPSSPLADSSPQVSQLARPVCCCPACALST